MKRNRLTTGLIVALGVASLTGLGHVQASEQTNEQASLATCYAKGLKDKLQCGHIMRPISDNPADGEFELHFTVIPAIKNAYPDEAILAFAGGPGQSATEIAASFERSLSVARQHRAIILVDQRGTGKSKKLECGSDDFASALKIDDLSSAAIEKMVSETKICNAESGVDFTYFNTVAAAPDFEAVRQHLGIKKLHLYGGSYGTRIAQEYARQFPSNVASMTLDGVVPMQQSLVAIGKAIDDSLHALFNDCNESEPCRASYPTLAQDFDELMVKLETKPVALTVKHPRTAADIELFLTPTKFFSAIRMALYSNATRALVPLVITQTKLGNYQPLLGLMSTTDLSGEMAIGMHNAVVCAEDWPIQDKLDVQVKSTFAGQQMAQAFDTLCPIYNVRPVNSDFYKPLNTAIPTLLLSGGLDPATPASWAELAKVEMKNALHLVAPTATHIVAGQTCADRIVADFISTKSFETLDTECLNKNTRSQFFLNLQSVEATPTASKE